MVKMARVVDGRAKIHFVPSARFDPSAEELADPLAANGSADLPLPGVAFVKAWSPRAGHVLAAAEEAAIFRRMNDLKRRAAQLLAQRDRLSGAESQIDGLLFEALRLRDGLATVFMGLASGLSRRFATGRFTQDELQSEACLTLLQAIENFNADLGFRFSTYATRAIRRNLYRFIMKRRALERREAASDVISEAPDYRLHEPADLDGPSPKEIHAFVGELRERDAFIVRRRFGLQMEGAPFTLQRVADELGVTRERVRQLENRALRQLRAIASERFSSLEA